MKMVEWTPTSMCAPGWRMYSRKMTSHNALWKKQWRTS
jgi:hypothetical protein